MCTTEDGGYQIPVAADNIQIPTTEGALKIVHNTMFHTDDEVLVQLVARAYLDVDRMWLQFRRELYAAGLQEEYTECDYKQAMLYLVACFEYADVLEDAVDLLVRMTKAETG